ncbi:DUF2877 domain-containing protein, partial [Streptomyces sp. SID3343]|uniref:DUF2877 domain-containing protein n=1 Tax=Streptomyces sp. SID3343 TaxID=2690260 RepID=UPI00136A2F79
PRPPAPGDVDTVRAGVTTLRTAIGTGTGFGGLPDRGRTGLAALGRHVTWDPHPERAATAAFTLLGLGPGLTPSGDDVLC